MPVVTLNKTNSVTQDNNILQGAPTTSQPSGTVFETGGTTSANDNRRGLIKFDLGLIPNDAIINSAQLTLRQTQGSASRTINIHKATQSWDNSVTWSTQPTFDPTTAASLLVNTVVENKIFDVQNLVQGWVNGNSPNYGMIIKDSDETTLSTSRQFGSFDNTTVANQPTLTVDYTIPSTGKKQVEYVGAGNSAASINVTTLTVPLPTGIQQGDLLIAQISSPNSATVNTPNGWTLLGADTSTTVIRQGIYYKFAETSEIAPAFTCSTAQNMYGTIFAYRNVKSVDVTTGNGGTGTQFSPGVLNGITADNSLAVIFNSNAGPYAYTPPLSYSETYDGNAVSIDAQSSYRYLYKNRSQTSGENISTISSSATGVSREVALIPFTNTLPTISDTDHDLGTFTAPFQKTYNVTDPDPGATVTIVEKLNGTVKRTIPNATLGATYTLDLTADWPTLKYGNHTATIEATDNTGAVTVRTWTFGKRLATTDDLTLATKGVQDIKPFLDAIKVKLVGKVGGSTADTFDNIIATMSVKKVKSGTFTISGAPVAVTGLGFTPRILFIKLNDSYFYFGFSDYNGNFYGLKNAAVSNATDLVRNADGFTVPVNATNYPSGAWQYYAGE